MQSFIAGIETDGRRLAVGALFGSAAERLDGRDIEQERNIALGEGGHRILAIAPLNRFLGGEESQIEAIGLAIDGEGSRVALERSPVDIGMIALELRIDQMVVLLTRHGVVIVFLPDAELLSTQAVFPYTIRAAPHPADSG